MQGTPPEFGCCRPVDLIRGHSLADEVGVDEPRLVSVCPAIRLDDSDECLEELDIVGVADIVSLVINGDLVLGLLEGPGALLSCPEVATVPSDKSQQLHYVL